METPVTTAAKDLYTHSLLLRPMTLTAKHTASQTPNSRPKSAQLVTVFSSRRYPSKKFYVGSILPQRIRRQWFSGVHYVTSGFSNVASRLVLWRILFPSSKERQADPCFSAKDIQDVAYKSRQNRWRKCHDLLKPSLIDLTLSRLCRHRAPLFNTTMLTTKQHASTDFLGAQNIHTRTAVAVVNLASEGWARKTFTSTSGRMDFHSTRCLPQVLGSVVQPRRLMAATHGTRTLHCRFWDRDKQMPKNPH